jgi:hypothetical protein
MSLVQSNTNSFLNALVKMANRVGGCLRLWLDFNQLLPRNGYEVMKRLQVVGKVGLSNG